MGFVLPRPRVSKRSLAQIHPMISEIVGFDRQTDVSIQAASEAEEKRPQKSADDLTKPGWRRRRRRRRKQIPPWYEVKCSSCLFQVSGPRDVLLRVPRLYRGSSVCHAEAGRNAADVVLRSAPLEETGTVRADNMRMEAGHCFK